MAKRKEFDAGYMSIDGQRALRQTFGQGQFRERATTACARWRTFEERLVIRMERDTQYCDTTGLCRRPGDGFELCAMCAYLERQCNVRFMRCCCCDRLRDEPHKKDCAERASGTCKTCCLNRRCLTRARPASSNKCENCAMGPLYCLNRGDDDLECMYLACRDERLAIESYGLLRVEEEAKRAKKQAEK